MRIFELHMTNAKDRNYVWYLPYEQLCCKKNGPQYNRLRSDILSCGFANNTRRLFFETLV